MRTTRAGSVQRVEVQASTGDAEKLHWFVTVCDLNGHIMRRVDMQFGVGDTTDDKNWRSRMHEALTADLVPGTFRVHIDKK